MRFGTTQIKTFWYSTSLYCKDGHLGVSARLDINLRTSLPTEFINKRYDNWVNITFSNTYDFNERTR